ncbi:MAG: amino acid ABC transporter permease [Allorhizobium sp.]
MAYGLDFGWLPGAAGDLASGAATTILLIGVAGLGGIVLSIAGACAKRSGVGVLQKFIAAYVELVRNTPFLVQLFFIYFGLPSLGVRFDPIVAAMLAMTLNMAAYGTEIVAAGIDAVPRGQSEAAKALGIRGYIVFTRIVLPQAMRVIYPALTGQIVIMMLESAVVSQISVRELTYEADMLQARTFRAFETYLAVTIIYFALSVGLRRLLVAGGRRFVGKGVS